MLTFSMLRGVGTASTTSRIVRITSNERIQPSRSQLCIEEARRYAGGGGGYRGDEIEANKQTKPDNYRYVFLLLLFIFTIILSQ